jgi:sortase B
VLRYYDFIQAPDKTTFDEYKKTIRQMDVLKTGIEFYYGDELLTLSTCNNYVEDGRLFLLAKRTDV